MRGETVVVEAVRRTEGALHQLLLPQLVETLLHKRWANGQAAGELGTSLEQLDEGLAAIERLSHETDLEIRRAATAAMGELGNEVFLPRLIELLDERRDIQIAAMVSLTAIAGRDVAQQSGEPLLPDDQVRSWKRWYAERTSSSP